MAILLDSSKASDISQWRMSWRLAQWGARIPSHQMQTLAQEDFNRLWKLIADLGFHDDFPFKKGVFSSVASLALNPVGHQDDLEAESPIVEKWLFARGVPFRRRVYLSYHPDTALVTTWKTLIRYWNLFYYSIADDLTVIDDTLTWALLFFHEHELYFGSKIPRG